MDSKRHISYQWRIFIPCAILLWAVIFGMFKWQAERVSNVRNEMAYDQLNVIGQHMSDIYAEGDTAALRRFARFSNRFYHNSSNYDPMCIWFIDTRNDSLTHRYGRFLSSDFPLPIEKKGIFDAPAKYINTDTATDTRFIYSVYLTPDRAYKIYVMLPYTKRLIENISSRTTYFWLLFLSVGVFVTILMMISISFFGRNIKMLRNFSYQAASDPNFKPPTDISFSNDELGDISRQILDIYNKRMEELDKREQEHKVAINAIEEKNRMKRELTGNISHELKTPVAITKLNIDTLVEDPDMPEETRIKFLKRTQENMNRLAELIKDITAITKLESGGKLVEITQINFHELIFNLNNEYIVQGNLLNGKMTFEYDIPLNCIVIGSPNLLTNVILNLLKNSLAYSGGTRCVLKYVKEENGQYFFKFYDNGVGVAPDHLSHLFDRFYRVKSGRSRTDGGTGLGLSIVKVTIESFGGTIDVDNRFPSGLEFTFSLNKANTDTEAGDSKA